MKQTLLRVALAFSIVAAPAAAQDCQAQASCAASKAKALVVVDEKAECASSCSAAKAVTVADEKAECASSCSAAMAVTVADEKAECASSCSATKALVVADEAQCASSCDAAKAEVVVDVVDPAAKLECAQSCLAKAEAELQSIQARLVSFETATSCDATASCSASKSVEMVAEATTESCTSSCSASAAVVVSALPECPHAAYGVVQNRLGKTRAHVVASRARLLVSRANQQDAAAPLARRVSEVVPAPATGGCCSGNKVQG